MEKLTIGQVIDKLQLDEVAVVVKNANSKVDGYLTVKDGVHYDVNDNNILKSLNGSEIAIQRVSKNEEDHLFVIIKKELYNSILRGKGFASTIEKGLPNEFDFLVQGDEEIFHAKLLANDVYYVTWDDDGGTSYPKWVMEKNINEGNWTVI